jgi:hypothetical protein
MTNKTIILRNLLRALAIISFVIGSALQIYNYQTFKKYNWSLVKQKVDLTKSGNQRFELLPNLSTQFEVILFYKKIIPQEGSLLDSSLTLQASLTESSPESSPEKESQNILWQHEHKPSKDFTVTLKGTEVILGKFQLDQSKRYNLDINVKTPTALNGKDIVLSVVTNQKLFREYFHSAGVIELFSYSLLILSFLFFIGFIIAPTSSSPSDSKES